MKLKLVAAVAAVAFGAVAGGAGAQEIKMWTLVNEDLPDFIAAAAAEFEAANEGVTIVHEEFPNEAYKTQIQVALTGSDPPDVFFNWSGEDAARLMRDGLAADITGLGSYTDHVGEGWLSAFAMDGRNFGVPHEAVAKYFYYDPIFFEEYGLSTPETFDGLLQLCRDIRAIDENIVPWPLGNSERWKMNHVITMLNYHVMGSDATAADYALTASDDELYTDEGYVEAWAKVVELMDAGCFQDAPNATSPEATRSMFAAQVSPMIYCGTWCANIFASEGYEGFEMFRFPVVEGGAGDAGGHFLLPQGFMVSAGSENPELAAEWISFLVSDAQARNYAEQIGNIVSNPALIDEVDGTRWFKYFVEDIAEADDAVMVLDVLLEASVANAYLDAGVEVLNRTMTPEEAMAFIREVALEAKNG